MQYTQMHPDHSSLVMNAEAKADYTRLLLNDFHALEAMISSDRMEKYVTRVGYELELNFLDSACAPACIGTEVCKALNDPHFTTEFSRFNLEINSTPMLLKGSCFATMEMELNAALAAVKGQAAKHDCSVLLTGIIPTLDKSHITPEALTPEPRYQALYDIRRALKGDQYEYRISGIDELLTRDNIALFAGSITSFQTHLQIATEDAVDMYNWAQLLAAPTLAVAANSPLFLGKRLWQETRIALFEQATDTRVPDQDAPRNRPRVMFGDKWVEQSVLELLQEDIINFEPLFRAPGVVEDAMQALDEGRAPKLDAWTLFNGSIYRWNRLCYGRLHGKPALRIENRVMPSGPTVQDMVANAAFWSGAMAGLPRRYRNVQQRLDFALVKENFFKAARYGVNVTFNWFDGPVPARELILDELLPIARAGLRRMGVDERDSERLLGIVHDRTASGKTGAQWLLTSYMDLQKSTRPEQALHALTEGMLARQDSGLPVHRWDSVDPTEGGNWAHAFCTVQKLMSANLYKVKVDDAVDLATHLMHWKRIGHVPVEDADGNLAGMITRNTLIDFMLKGQQQTSTLKAGELMDACPVRISPDTPLTKAMQLMLDNALSFLPVVSNNSIVGLVTEHDFVKVAQALAAAQERGSNGTRIANTTSAASLEVASDGTGHGNDGRSGEPHVVE